MNTYPVDHPVFPADVPADELPKLEAAAEPLMAFSRERLAELIVPRTTFFNVACPNCDGGTGSDANRWLWSIDSHDRITCRFCGNTYPDPRYPLDHETTVTDSTGQKQTYRYFLGKDGYKHYLDMRIENCWKIHVEQAACTLARLHAATGRPEVARQALLILDRLADVYPHYSPHGIEGWHTMAPQIHDLQLVPVPEDGLQPVPGLQRDMPDYKTPYPYCSGMRADSGDNWFYAEMPPHLAEAYDRVAAGPACAALSDELGKDVGANIASFLRATANYARTFPLYLSNMDPSLITGLAVIGRVIGEPEFVHDALRRTRLILDLQFYPDGIWREGAPSYHRHTVFSLLRCVEGPLKGYSDPDGYANPEDGLHLADLDPEREVPMLQESIEALARMRLPNGHDLPVHDTWSPQSHGHAIESVTDEPLDTVLMWGLGQAIMGLRRGMDGVQAALHFSGSYGHSHHDNLDLSLFAHDRELLSDIGYTHTGLRPFTLSTPAHNLVVVDRADQEAADGRLLAWAADGDRLRFCEASAEGAYPDRVTEYRRAAAAIALPDGGAYVVDLFRVSGGQVHDWCLHGSADYDQVLACSLPLEPFPGSLLPPGVSLDRGQIGQAQSWRSVQDGVSLAYDLFDDLRSASTDETWALTFRFASNDGPGLRTTVLGQPGTAVHCGAIPSIRRAQEQNAAIWDYAMPVAVARRTGQNLNSAFAAVHEPCRGDTPALEVSRLELAEGGASAVGIRCQGDGFCDYHLIGQDATSRLRLQGLDLSATGRYAFVRTRGEQVERMVLVDGAGVTFCGRKLAAPEPPKGQVLGVERAEAGAPRDAIVVDAAVAPRKGKPHERVIVAFGDGSTLGLAVKEIVREGNRTAILLDHRPGFDLSEDGRIATHTHHPHREMPGHPRFRLSTVVVWPQ